MMLNIRNILRKRKLRAPLEKEDWNRAKVFVKFLKMFYDVTLKFSESLHVTSNFVFLKNWWLCKEHCKKWLMGGGGDKVIAVYACRMKEKFSKYWKN